MTQPQEALRLADELCVQGPDYPEPTCFEDAAARELRRLHEVNEQLSEANERLTRSNQELLEALEEVMAYCKEHGHDWMCMAQARAAIQKATQGNV